MKLLIPIIQKKGKDHIISKHFGHAPFFAIYDNKKKETKIVNNNLDHSNEKSTPIDQLMIYNPDMVYVIEIGQRAISLLNEKGIKVKTGDFEKLSEVIENTDKLQEVTKGCKH